MKLKSILTVGALFITQSAFLSRANIVFNLIPEPGTPQYAMDGFAAAANCWSSVLADNITVNVQVGFVPLGQLVIGQAGSDFREYSYLDTMAALTTHGVSAADGSSVGALQPGASYSRFINHTSNNPNGANSAVPYLTTMNRVGMTTANAKALGLLAPSPSVDAVIRFNSTFGFDFDAGDGIAVGQFDFLGAATHEMGHALGFVSGVDDVDQLGGVYPDGDFSSNLLDLFRFSALSLSAGPGITDLSADNRSKFFSVDGGLTQGPLFSNGYFNGDGRQASHWKDFMGLGIMDPTAFPGELKLLREEDLRALDVLGYTLVPEPATGALLVIGTTFLLWRRSALRR
jgi:hypothetical protein